MLEFASTEARDTAISHITPLLAGKSTGQSGSGIEPTGAHAAVKKELLQEDRCETYQAIVSGLRCSLSIGNCPLQAVDFVVEQAGISKACTTSW